MRTPIFPVKSHRAHFIWWDGCMMGLLLGVCIIKLIEFKSLCLWRINHTFNRLLCTKHKPRRRQTRRLLTFYILPLFLFVINWLWIAGTMYTSRCQKKFRELTSWIYILHRFIVKTLGYLIRADQITCDRLYAVMATLTTHTYRCFFFRNMCTYY